MPIIVESRRKRPSTIEKAWLGVLILEALTARDVGLEQQAVQILEHPPPNCSLDWSVLEEVEAAVGQNVAAQLRGADEGRPCALHKPVSE
jgi:hypothetical protein